MKLRARHPMLRKTAKWLAVLVTALLLFAWLGSGKIGAAHRLANGQSVSLWRGRVWVYPSEGFAPRGPSRYNLEWRTGPGYGLDWWMSNFKRYDKPIRAFPVWWVALPALSVTIALWRRDAILTRRWLLGHCGKCGYDRAGLAVGAVCPECGGKT